MTISYKVLGQATPGGGVETDLYTVPGSTSAIVSSIVICNRGGTQTTFRVSISVGGGATANKDYLYYDVPLSGNDTFVATIGVTLTATDKLRVNPGNANLSFSLYGSEVT